MLSSSSIVHVNRQVLGDKGLFSTANILQIADAVHQLAFLLFLLLANGSCITYFFLVKRVKCFAIFVLTTKTAQPRPQVFSVNGSIIWQFYCTY